MTSNVTPSSILAKDHTSVQSAVVNLPEAMHLPVTIRALVAVPAGEQVWAASMMTMVSMMETAWMVSCTASQSHWRKGKAMKRGPLFGDKPHLGMITTTRMAKVHASQVHTLRSKVDHLEALLVAISPLVVDSVLL